jgi:hypothetical protein
MKSEQAVLPNPFLEEEEEEEEEERNHSKFWLHRNFLCKITNNQLTNQQTNQPTNQPTNSTKQSPS